MNDLEYEYAKWQNTRRMLEEEKENMMRKINYPTWQMEERNWPLLYSDNLFKKTRTICRTLLYHDNTLKIHDLLLSSCAALKFVEQVYEEINVGRIIIRLLIISKLKKQCLKPYLKSSFNPVGKRK